ncbi:MAG: glutaredoxin [Candidatus Thermoplasmatota archaeon]|nr:thioredoxin family protein [archaeon]MBU2564651.1 glutaredoxin [Candidatus Thermoplasmatota archaeon]MCG2826128.1 glutaredoxin [Thermoplasmatales archaeon]MBU3902199.1 glutaredoxin [Candidatus Thermoplasmatota archaeon]MBU4189839.1 glutaredoxin [Candidatus Thermoplasmatota archaeon]
MFVKLFWKHGCQKCITAKEICKNSGLNVKEYDVETVDGMAEASFHQVTRTPAIVLVDDDENEIKKWDSILQAKKELGRMIK